MKPWLRWALGLATAVATGLGSAWWVLKGMPLGVEHTARSGPWVAHLLAGSPQADLYTRARVSLFGLLALGRDETLYYVARNTTAGEPLKARCRYRVSGMPPQALWWSLTAYGDDLFLFDAPERRFSISSSNAAITVDGQFVLATGPQATPGLPWLPTPGPGGLVLTLRLYHPGTSLQAQPASLAAPRVEVLEACP